MTDDELLDAMLDIDPDRSNIILAVGKKGSGKSEGMHQIFNAWPYDRGVLDITGDACPDGGPDVVTAVTAPFKPLNDYRKQPGDRLTLWIRISPQQEEKAFLAAEDEAIKLGLFPQRNPFLLWIDEYGRMFKKGAGAGPNLSLALQSSRHYGPLSMLLPCPRPRHIDPLTIQQADLVFIYELANADDREVIAKNIGYPLADFERAYFANQARGKHSFLLYNAKLNRMFDCPPLPITKSHGGRA